MSNEPAKRRLRGRPTKYRPEYCDAVIEHMRDGARIKLRVATRSFPMWAPPLVRRIKGALVVESARG